MLNYLWFPLLDRLYKQLPNVWLYLQAKGELADVNWKKVYISRYNYTDWSIIDGELRHNNRSLTDKQLIAISPLSVLVTNGEQYSRTKLEPIKSLSLIEFMLPYHINIAFYPFLKVGELRRRLHELGTKHKLRILEVTQVCITLQLRPPSVLMNMIYQVINELR